MTTRHTRHGAARTKLRGLRGAELADAAHGFVCHEAFVITPCAVGNDDALVSAAGFTLVELLVALAIALVVSAGVVKLADEARTFFVVQPEVMDVTQRARVGVELLTAELTSAGAGASLGTDAGPLIRWIPPIVPARYQGSGASDPAGQIFFDRLTIVTAAENVPLVAVRGAMAGAAAAVPIAGAAGCPAADAVCGFRAGQRIAVFDRTGAFDLATIRAAAALPGPPSGSAELFHDASALAKAFREEDDGRVVQVRAVTYYHDAARNQLRRATGPRADAPVLDDVVGLSFRYFGDRAPPTSPRPSAGAANCLFDVAGVPALGALAPDDGDQVELTEVMLTDGPWCGASAGPSGGGGGGGGSGGSGGSGSAAGVSTVFDADLYRVRRIRVTLRVQASPSWARGRDRNLFQRPGTAMAARLLVPDYIITFDVSPRNLQVGGMT
jgi:prepilin-type N-terminal cleavage/methylation domain-containing protein